ncbi:hypothetical protein ARSEF1564_001927 [Beauveria bassiana]
MITGLENILTEFEKKVVVKQMQDLHLVSWLVNASTLDSEFSVTTSVIVVSQMDVSGDETINAAYETVEARSGYLDVLVNNDSQPLEMRMFKSEYTMRKAWNQMYDVHVTGTQILTNTFVPLLLQFRIQDAWLLSLTSGLAQLETMRRSTSRAPRRQPVAQAKCRKLRMRVGRARRRST